MAERQLFNHNDDNTQLWLKIEISFRITASIYKFVQQTESSIVEPLLPILNSVMKRDKSQLFDEIQLNARPNLGQIQTIDENANEIDIRCSSQVSINNLWILPIIL